ncbi:MAG: hypothetical protein OWQ54_04405 [Sulfolobaceae archaeon]|nr:hypothetical protein [Sulfolobaceae archaeon]
MIKVVEGRDIEGELRELRVYTAMLELDKLVNGAKVQGGKED